MKTKKRILSILLICCMVLTMLPAPMLLPTAALAATSVQYLDSDGSSKSCSNYTTMTKTTTTWSSGWYVVPAGTMSIGDPNSASRVIVDGDVHLILADDCYLTIYGGIRVDNGNSLTIYGQSNPTVSGGNVSGSTGKLTAVSPYNQNNKFMGGTTAIGHATNGSLNCDITINGGVIDARGSGHYPGIQGKNVTINGGYVKATVPTSPEAESPYPSGIAGKNVTINDGYVDATGGDGGAGICYYSIVGSNNVIEVGSVTINDGNVKAKGGDYGAGIGSRYRGFDGIVTIYGGTVDATGGLSGAGIGGGNEGKNSTITISGGNVTAKGGDYGAGIGGGELGSGASVNINGGTVKATGWLESAGIGIGFNGSSTSVTITGSAHVEATGGTAINPRDLGAGISGGDGGSVTISGGTVKATGASVTAGNGAAGIGSGSCTFTTTASGKAIIKANSISDQSGKTSWSGIIFEGSNGRVYGNQSLNKTLAIDNGETLLIGNGATLTTGGHVTNNGAVCVGGTLSGTVSGDLYYPLTVTGGTATAANTKTIDGVTYVKQGDSVTLNPDTLQAGYKFENWSVTSGGVTISNNSFTMPGNAVAVTANTTQMVKITTQPQGTNVTYGANVALSVAAQNKNGNTDGITYQWYKGSTPVAGETSATLTLTKPNAGTYNYYCAVSYGGCTINSNTVTVTVGKATGSVSITGNLDKTYDGQPAGLAAAGYTVTGDGRVTVKYTKRGENNYSTTAPKDAGDYTVKVTKAAGTNYTEAYATKNFTITPKTIGIQWGSTTFTYSGSEQCPTATATGLVGNDTCAITVTGGQTNAGDHTATATALGNGNYKLPGDVNQTFEIAPKDITVTITPNGGVYAGTINPAAAELTGVCEGDTVDLTLTYTGTANDGTVVNSTDTPALAGTYTVTATIADSNYNLTGTNTAKFVVAKANAGLYVGTVPIKTYGDESFKLDVHADSDGKVTYSSDNEDTATVDENGTVTLHNAGTATLTVEIAETANYEGGEVTVTLTVVRKNATLTVEKLTYSVTYGDADFIIGYASEGESSVTFTSSNEKVATVDKNGVVHIVSAGSTTITLNMEQSGNYNAVSKKVEVIVAPKAITVTADNQTKTYGGDDPKLTYTAVGLVGEDTLTGITLTRADGENAGEYDITASQTNGANPNYEITFVSGMLTIAARDIADAEVELGAALIANGKTQEQNIQRVTVKNAKGEELEVTYTVTGNQATELGAYTMTITGTGNFTGTVTKNFVIAPAADSKVDTNESGDVVIGKGTISLEVGQETGKAAIIEMLVASGDLTAEELSLVGDGASIRVLLKVTVASTTITEESKAQIEKAAEGYVIGQYIDISVFKQTICNGQAGELIRLTGTYEEMKISLVVPENLLNRDNSVTRTFWIIRNHDGKVEFLPATFDAQTNTLTFKTDKFSDYAIVYKDAKNAAENPTRPDDTATGTPPQTGDHTILWICFVLLFISCGGMITTIYISKRKKKKFE